MKRLTAVLLALASFVLVGSSYGQGLSGPSLFQSRISWQRLNFRNTSASATARNPNWAAPYLAPGFTDSVVFRKGAAGLTTYDTTAAYPIKEFAFAPAAFASQATGGDTLAVPWLILRLSQDTTSFVSTLGAVPTAMDSFRVAAQVSADGVTWFNANGTPTRAFDAVYFTSSAEDGSQAVDLAGVDISGATGGADIAYVTLGCSPSAGVAGGSPIINKTLCTCGLLVRFLIGNDGIGQFVLDAGTFERVQ
jgi:hypothetical protein